LRGDNAKAEETGMSENITPGRTTADQASPLEAPRAHVLIVDDHAASRAICADYCDLFDHTAEAVRSRAEAVEALQRTHFDVVVMSVHMEGACSLEAVQAIRGLPAPAAHTPIIGLAAPGRADEAQRWLAAGVAGVVAKPVTAKRLFAAISSVVTPASSTTRSWAPAAG
jgi:CheY-like chemotaxis protein